MAQVVVARGEINFRAHECGEPWTIFGAQLLEAQACLRFGYDGAALLRSVLELPYVNRTPLVCIPCDVVLIGVGTSSPRYLSDLDQAARSLEEFATR